MIGKVFSKIGIYYWSRKTIIISISAPSWARDHETLV